MSLLQLFIAFIQVGMFSIGGGYAAMPLIQAQVVEKYGWLTLKEFTDLITIAEMTPGPIAVNSATFVGIRIGGFVGAITATFAVILPSILIVSLLAYIYYKYKNISTLQNILGMLRPCVVALIASAALSIIQLVLFDGATIINPIETTIMVVAFITLCKTKFSPILVMLSCGAIELLIYTVAGLV